LTYCSSPDWGRNAKRWSTVHITRTSYKPVMSKRAACEQISNEFVDEGTETHAP
jgi:hypothetical protein